VSVPSAVSNHRRTTGESQRLADQRWRCGDAKGQASRDFYAQKVGLEIVSENDNAVTFQSGGGTRLTVSASTTGTSDEQTQAS